MSACPSQTRNPSYPLRLCESANPSPGDTTRGGEEGNPREAGMTEILDGVVCCAEPFHHPRRPHVSAGPIRSTAPKSTSRSSGRA
jgi:hypothetical protein